MTITGLFQADDNFVTVFDDATKTIYTKARNSGEWGSVRVGERTFMGPVLTEETYAEMRSECTETGTFRIGD